MEKIFEYKRICGGILTEYRDGKDFLLEYSEEGFADSVRICTSEYAKADPSRLYLGHTMEEVIDCGRDLLGEALLAKGEPEYADTVGVLPRIEKNAYCFIGGPSSHAGLIVDTAGRVYPQLSGKDRDPEPFFTPEMIDSEISDVIPRQFMLGYELPLLVSLFEKDGKYTELIYFVEPCDSDRDPTLWIRIKRWRDGGEVSFDYRISSISRELNYTEMEKVKINCDTVRGAFADTLVYWMKERRAGTVFNFPNERLCHVATAAPLFAILTSTADRPHYGHKFYGKELHDNFPPNYIWSFEAYCLLGRGDRAARMLTYMLNYAISDEGCIIYRQGAAMNFGASASEYGMLLQLIAKNRRSLELEKLSRENLMKLCGMGNVIVSHAVKCPEFEDRVLIKMCAEADTNSRINVYLANNLWSVRGLRALGTLMKEYELGDPSKYINTADIIEQNINYMINKLAARGTRFGDIVPFRLGYTPTPYTLSNCKDSFVPVNDEEWARYMQATKVREVDSAAQDITENTYSNYRYFPEALSAMMLDSEYADSIERMRESIGGELLAMTRFRSWVDDWPVMHHARFLIETGRIDKLLLLLYSHTEHHGIPELVTYYEQIKLWGEVSAHDCTPSLLTTPILTGWLFAYERVGKAELRLLSAIPKSWYYLPFSVNRLGYSDGSVDISCDGESVKLEFSSPTEIEVRLVWRCKDKLCREDILCGEEFAEDIDGNEIIIKKGTVNAVFKIKR